MSVRPGNLCKLSRGVILDAHAGFVDTWNWIVDFVDNLKGDKDVGARDGTVVVDRSVSDRPIIRVAGGKLQVVGTDGSKADCRGTLSFASAADSNVEAKVEADAAGNVTVKIGVYYK